ncbi:hypothetical protein V496_03387 [Pseudogymnoascus sp. VKM F-4515 (FW-2607)]|nr:hypothetical protein V496_03387 [Pseudogymnoascus sp. VKM F-4515 (FW-2607)]
MSEEDKTTDEVLLNFKVKTSSDGLHNITIPDTATVLDLKTKLAGEEYENVPTDRQRLIYSGRVLKNEEHLATYKIKNGNTIHMVKSAASNAAQNPANAGAGASATPGAAATGVPTNMAAGTANNPLANLTGARYAGQVNLPSRDMFGVDGGMGAPPNEDQVADMLSDPATAQMMNEALNNPQMVDMMIQANPTLRALGPAAREMLQSPMFRQMMTDPNMIRQAARMQRQMGGGGGASAFPAPGVTDTTPSGASGAGGAQPQGQAGQPDMSAMFPGLFGAGGGAGAGNPFASLFQPQGQGAAQSPPAAGSPGAQQPGQPGAEGAPSNPFASLLSGGPGGAAGGNPFGYGPPPTPEQMRHAMQMFGQMSGGEGGANPFAGFGGAGAGGATSPPPPADTRPPEEVYADQLRALNDMGFFDFEANVRALRRSGGSVQGAVEQLLG